MRNWFCSRSISKLKCDGVFFLRRIPNITLLYQTSININPFSPAWARSGQGVLRDVTDLDLACTRTSDGFHKAAGHLYKIHGRNYFWSMIASLNACFLPLWLMIQTGWCSTEVKHGTMLSLELYNKHLVKMRQKEIKMVNVGCQHVLLKFPTSLFFFSN